MIPSCTGIEFVDLPCGDSTGIGKEIVSFATGGGFDKGEIPSLFIPHLKKCRSCSSRTSDHMAALETVPGGPLQIRDLDQLY